MLQLSTSNARKHFAKAIKCVCAGDRVLIKSHNRGVAAIVSVEDLAVLQAIEDASDLAAARAAIAEAKEQGTTSWGDLKASFSL